MQSVKAILAGEFRYFLNARHAAHGTNGDVAGGDRGSIVIRQNTDRVKHCVHIFRGLAHAHEHNVLDLKPAATVKSIFNSVARREPLRHNFRRA